VSIPAASRGRARVTQAAGTPAEWTCPSCEAIVSTSYCATCGEKALRPRDLTLRGLAEQFIEAVGSLDSGLARTLRLLLVRPGALTAAWMSGRRTPFIGPAKLFRDANAAFFAVQSLTHESIFSSTLESHLHHQDWSAIAQSLVDRKLALTGMTLEHYAAVFDHAVVLNAKALVILMVLPFALALHLLGYGTRLPFAANAVYALNFYAFLLLLFCVGLLVGAADMLFGGGGLASSPVDKTLSIVNVCACAAWLYAAEGVLHGGRRAARIARTALLTVAAVAIFFAYRFGLFLITLYTT
jgi:hypothetical protein